jgi:hypothetical protein
MIEYVTFELANKLCEKGFPHENARIAGIEYILEKLENFETV